MRPGFYGFGFNVGTTSDARVSFSHSGAFELGAGTNFVIIPSADVAIVALTNATPSGVPETLTAEFGDLVQFGRAHAGLGLVPDGGQDLRDHPPGAAHRLDLRGCLDLDHQLCTFLQGTSLAG